MKKIEEYEFNGFKYRCDYSHENNFTEIIHDKTSPDHLYKFYAMNKYGVEAVIESYLYASHPIELNDILDSSPFLIYSSKPLEYDRYYQFYKELISDEEEIKKIWLEDKSEFNRCGNYLKHMYSVTFNKIGIISLTAKEKNTLMWPHYTQEKGFQVKFRTENLLDSIREKLEEENNEFLGLFPINYVETIKPVDASSFNFFYIPVSYASNVKSNEWKYEDEWRLLGSKKNMGVPFSKSGLNTIPDIQSDKENRQLHYDLKDIEEICLGLNFITAKDFEIIRDNEMEFTVKIKEDSDNYNNYSKLLNFISDKLPDKLYYSGIKYELDGDEPFLIRTKEKQEITKLEDDKFYFKRTNEIIRL